MKNKNDYINFEISRDTPIIIYGAAGAGLRGYHSLKTLNRYNVVGFIDKRADEIKNQYGLPVWKVDSILPYKKEDVLIVICVKNIFEHEKIVSQLIENYYTKIIFKPLQAMKQETKIDYASIDNNYRKIFNDEDPNMQYDLESIPILKSIQIYNYCDYAIMSRKGNIVISNMPLSDIYIKMQNQAGFLHNDYWLCNSLALVPHIGLFQFFNGNDGNIDGYLEFCISTIQNSKMLYGEGGTIDVTDAWCNNIIRNRSIVFDNMNIDAEIDSNFFINNAPSCYLDQNYIVMNSAKHRAAFFIVKGKKYMPIAISTDEYEKLLNLPILQDLIEFLETNKIQELNAPVQHPYMYKYPCRMANYYELFVKNLVFCLAEVFGQESDLKRITVENAIQDDGALSRCLSKIGFNIKTVCIDHNDLQLYHILDRLFYIYDSKYKDGFESADVVCIQTTGIKKATNIYTAKMLVVLGEDGYILENRNFVLKKKLFRTIWDNKVVAGYMYLNKNLEK